MGEMANRQALLDDLLLRVNRFEEQARNGRSAATEYRQSADSADADAERCEGVASEYRALIASLNPVAGVTVEELSEEEWAPLKAKTDAEVAEHLREHERYARENGR